MTLRVPVKHKNLKLKRSLELFIGCVSQVLEPMCNPIRRQANTFQIRNKLHQCLRRKTSRVESRCKIISKPSIHRCVFSNIFMKLITPAALVYHKSHGTRQCFIIQCLYATKCLRRVVNSLTVTTTSKIVKIRICFKDLFAMELVAAHCVSFGLL